MTDSSQWPAALQGDPDARIEALTRLDALPEHDRLAPLIAMLGDPEWRVRKTAANRLKKMAAAADLLAPLTDAVVRDGDPWLRTSAMETIVSLGCRDADHDRVVTFLLEVLARTPTEPRKFVIEILGQLTDSRAVPALIGELHDSDENLQLSVLIALAQIGDRVALPAVLERLQQGSGQVRFAALSTLQQLADPTAVPAVVSALAERPLRRLAMETLGLVGDTQAMTPLWQYWTGGSRSERDSALITMAQIMERAGEPERSHAVAWLRQSHRPADAAEIVTRLEEPDPKLQEAATALAGWVLEPAALQPLVRLLGGDLAPHAKQTLGLMAAEHLDALLALLPRATPTIHRALIEVLSGIVDPRLLLMMRTELASPDHRIRRAAALAVAAYQDHESAPLLVELLSDGDDGVQEAALTALDRCGTAAIVPSVIPLLSNESPLVRRNAVKALGLLRVRTGAAPLVLTLNDPDAGVRAAAIASLQAMGDALGVEALTGHLLLALGDEAAHVRLAAARAMAQYADSVPVEWWSCLIEDPDQWVRAMTPRMAERSRGQQAAAVLQRCLRDESGAVQIAALEAIGRRPDLGSLEAVRPALGSDDPDVAAAALNAVAVMILAGTPAPEAVRSGPAASADEAMGRIISTIIHCLAHQAWVVRVAALRALAAIAPAEARRQAATLARDPDDRVREAAARLRDDATPSSTTLREDA